MKRTTLHYFYGVSLTALHVKRLRGSQFADEPTLPKRRISYEFIPERNGRQGEGDQKLDAESGAVSKSRAAAIDDNAHMASVPAVTAPILCHAPAAECRPKAESRSDLFDWTRSWAADDRLALGARRHADRPERSAAQSDMARTKLGKRLRLQNAFDPQARVKVFPRVSGGASSDSVRRLRSGTTEQVDQ